MNRKISESVIVYLWEVPGDSVREPTSGPKVWGQDERTPCWAECGQKRRSILGVWGHGQRMGRLHIWDG